LFFIRNKRFNDKKGIYWHPPGKCHIGCKDRYFSPNFINNTTKLCSYFKIFYLSAQKTQKKSSIQRHTGLQTTTIHRRPTALIQAATARIGPVLPGVFTFYYKVKKLIP